MPTNFTMYAKPDSTIELSKLAFMLAAEAIPFQIAPITLSTGVEPALFYPSMKDLAYTINCRHYIRSDEGRLEVRGLTYETSLSATDVFKRIYRSWTQDKDEYEEDEDE